MKTKFSLQVLGDEQGEKKTCPCFSNLEDLRKGEEILDHYDW